MTVDATHQSTILTVARHLAADNHAGRLTAIGIATVMIAVQEQQRIDFLYNCPIFRSLPGLPSKVFEMLPFPLSLPYTGSLSSFILRCDQIFNPDLEDDNIP